MPVQSATAVAYSNVPTPLGVPFVAVQLVCATRKSLNLRLDKAYQISGDVIAGLDHDRPVFHFKPQDIFETYLRGSALTSSPTFISGVGKIVGVDSTLVPSPLYAKALVVRVVHERKVSLSNSHVLLC
jgi:hypothetical protein